MNKKGIRLSLEIFFSTLGLFGWWSIFYPQLSYTPETVKIIYLEELDNQTASLWDDDGTKYESFLNANGDQIVFRSKLFDALCSFWETYHDKD